MNLKNANMSKDARPLKGPERRGIGWITGDWPQLNRKLEVVKAYLNKRKDMAGCRKLSSAQTLELLLDFYMSANGITFVVKEEEV